MTQHRQPPRAVVGLEVEEFLDITDIDCRTILFSSFVIEKQRVITQGRQRDVDGSVATRQRSGASAGVENHRPPLTRSSSERMQRMSR